MATAGYPLYDQRLDTAILFRISERHDVDEPGVRGHHGRANRDFGREQHGERRDLGRAALCAPYHTPPSATVIASPFTPVAASLHRNAMTCATSRGSSTRFCG